MASPYSSHHSFTNYSGMSKGAQVNAEIAKTYTTKNAAAAKANAIATSTAARTAQKAINIGADSGLCCRDVRCIGERPCFSAAAIG